MATGRRSEEIQQKESVRTCGVAVSVEVVELDWEWYDPEVGLMSDKPARGDPLANWLHKIENGFGYELGCV